MSKSEDLPKLFSYDKTDKKDDESGCVYCKIISKLLIWWQEFMEQSKLAEKTDARVYFWRRLSFINYGTCYWNFNSYYCTEVWNEIRTNLLGTQLPIHYDFIEKDFGHLQTFEQPCKIIRRTERYLFSSGRNNQKASHQSKQVAWSRVIFLVCDWLPDREKSSIGILHRKTYVQYKKQKTLMFCTNVQERFTFQMFMSSLYLFTLLPHTT